MIHTEESTVYKESHIQIADIEIFSGNLLYFTATKDAEVNLESAKRLIRAANEIRDSSIPYRGCVCDMSQLSHMHRDARSYLASGEDVEGAVAAVALISSSLIGRVIGNLFISLGNPQIFPVKFFDSPISAEHWVRTKMNEVKDEISSNQNVRNVA